MSALKPKIELTYWEYQHVLPKPNMENGITEVKIRMDATHVTTEIVTTLDIL